MHTPASIAKHPIHPMLVPLPIGLWIFSLVCDLAFVFGGTGAAWKTVANYTLIGGIVGALIAAIPGVVDMLSLSGRPKKTALVHMSLNLTIVALQVLNAWLRTGAQDPAISLPVWISLLAVGLLAISGWLGGHMVYVEHVAVNPPQKEQSSATS